MTCNTSLICYILGGISIAWDLLRQFSRKTVKTHYIFRAKMCETTQTLKISEEYLFTISHEHLSMRSCTQSVSSQFTKYNTQKIQSGCDCLSAKNSSLCWYVTLDEKCIHHFSPEWNHFENGNKFFAYHYFLRKFCLSI